MKKGRWQTKSSWQEWAKIFVARLTIYRTGDWWNLYFFEKNTKKKSLERKKEQSMMVALEGTDGRVRTANNKSLHRKRVSTPPKIQKSPKNKHLLRGPGGKYVRATEKAQKLEEDSISETKSEIRMYSQMKKTVILDVTISPTVNRCTSTLT